MTATITRPRLAAVQAWLGGGDLSAPIDWVEPPDPWAGMTPAERQEAVLRACASGVWAELPVRRRVVTELKSGRRLPPPHARRKESTT